MITNMVKSRPTKVIKVDLLISIFCSFISQNHYPAIKSLFNDKKLTEIKCKGTL